MIIGPMIKESFVCAHVSLFRKRVKMLDKASYLTFIANSFDKFNSEKDQIPFLLNMIV